LVVVNDSVCRVRAGVKVLGASRVVVQRRGSAVVCSASPVSTAKLAVQGVSRNVVEVLEERGLIESVTSEELRAACTKQRLKVYCGFDPTAESLHLGNLLGIIVLSWFQRCVRHVG
jgi:tyrosyl-tRNA synthetase